MFLIRIDRAPRPVHAAGLASVLAGIRFIRRQPAVLGAISLDMFAVLLGGATALLPIYARDILHTGPWGLGLLRSSTAVGALGMALWLAHHPLRGNAGRRMFAAVAVFGVATIVFGVSQSFVVSLLALTVLGASDMISVVVRQTLVQLQTPDHMRGRVSAVNSLFIGTSNQLGEFESGVDRRLARRRPVSRAGGCRHHHRGARVDAALSIARERGPAGRTIDRDRNARAGATPGKVTSRALTPSPREARAPHARASAASPTGS